MRGTAPLLVDVARHALPARAADRCRSRSASCSSARGIFAIAFAQRHHHPRAAVYWALANAAIIAVYTLVDGAGARASGSALGYVLWLTFLEGFAFLAWIRATPRPRGRSPTCGAQWRRGLLGGFCSVAAYGIVLWAMTRAPVAAVAALRETSVLFAAIIGTRAAEGRLRPGAPRRRGERGRRRRGAQALEGHSDVARSPSQRRSSSSAAASPARPPRIT